jgi:aldose 1-epimerase
VIKATGLVGSFFFGCFLVSGLASVDDQRSGRSELLEAASDYYLQEADKLEGVSVASFGATIDGTAVALISCENRLGQKMSLTDYGAAMVSLELPDRNGMLANVILTCPDIAGFEACGMYFNAIAGRYCNRIARGRFSIDGTEYQLALNNGDHHLHGGVRGFDKHVWTFEPFSDAEGVGVRFSRSSPDGEEGYPGTVEAMAKYTLTHAGELVVELQGTADKPTHLNMTNHNYWNLRGSGDILSHELQIHGAKYLPVDEGGIPTGELAEVAGRPFDFTNAKVIGQDLGQVTGEPGGFDHCWAIDGTVGELRPAARLSDPESGRWMEILTTEPGLQFYSGNYLNGEAAAGGYAQRHGLCLETQRFPDSPNHPEFPSSLLKPGETYFHKTVHRFGADK